MSDKVYVACLIDAHMLITVPNIGELLTILAMLQIGSTVAERSLHTWLKNRMTTVRHIRRGRQSRNAWRHNPDYTALRASCYHVVTKSCSYHGHHHVFCCVSGRAEILSVLSLFVTERRCSQYLSPILYPVSLMYDRE